MPSPEVSSQASIDPEPQGYGLGPSTSSGHAIAGSGSVSAGSRSSGPSTGSGHAGAGSGHAAAGPEGSGPSTGPGSSGLRASDGDREQVATVLTTAYAEGRITKDEHDERLDQVLRARTFDDLIPITQDLVPLSAAPPAPAQTTPASSFAIEPSTRTEAETLVGVFGGATRKGKWRLARRTNAYAAFGGIDLDLRDATFEGREVEISGFWIFGGMDIKAPAGLEVRDRTVGIFGGSDISNLDEPAPGAPVLTIKGLCLFGGVSVKGPKPSKAAKQGRRHGCH